MPKDPSPQKVNAAKTLKRLQYSHLNLIWDMALGLKDMSLRPEACGNVIIIFIFKP